MDVREKPAVSLSIVILAGLSALAVAMGIGRFAYTPILPLMQADRGFSETVAGLVAAANYLGYFLAALCSSLFSQRHSRTFWLQIHLVLNMLTTGIMGWVDQAATWAVIRFLSGWSSGVVFVLSSNIVLDRLLTDNRNRWMSGFLYSGVGLGIAFSGLATPLFAGWQGWRGAWWGLMVFSALTIPLVWYGLRETPNWPSQREAGVASHPSVTRVPQGSPSHRYRWLVLAYGLEGFGYIVSGTFLVAAVVGLPGMAHDGAFSWVLVGLAAAPSTVVWSRIAARWGEQRALLAAYLLQAVGVVLPALYPHRFLVFLSAVLFGGTFMGITTLAMNVGRNLAPAHGRVVGQLTAVYGLGQMMGPAVAGAMATWTGGYGVPLVFAGGVVLAGAGALVPLMMKRRKRHAVCQCEDHERGSYAETKGRIDSAHHESVGGRVGEKSADDVCSH